MTAVIIILVILAGYALVFGIAKASAKPWPGEDDDASD